MSNPKLRAASAKREVARARLMDDVQDVKARLAPSALADKAITTAGRQAQHLVWRRPGTIATVVASLGLFAARGRLARWISARRKKGDATRADDAS